MLGKFQIGIMGTGNIAGVMADTVNKMKNVKLYAVASREKVKADVFAGKYGCKKAYGSYEELASDNKVDLTYIATPHSEHFANAKMCIEHGKPVLCEKAFTANAMQAEELIRLSEEKGVFLAEAMWTRYMPMLTTIREVIGSGVIGEPKTLTANLGYAVSHLERMKDPNLAGGARLDLCIYPLNFALMLFGYNIAKIHSSCTYTDTGVDEQDSITLQYIDGRMAHLNSSMVSLSDRKGIVYGTKGFIIVENINNFQSVAVYDSLYKKVGLYKCPKQISGYEYEVEASVKAIRSRQIECAEMPHAESLRVMKIMDSIRKEWGIVFPFEKAETEPKSVEEKTEQEAAVLNDKQSLDRENQESGNPELEKAGQMENQE